MKNSDIINGITEMLSLMSNDREKLSRILSFSETLMLEKKEDIGENEIIKKYSDSIAQIADAIDSGIICYLNPDTMEIEQVFNDTVFDTEDFEEQNEDRIDDYDMNYIQWDSYIKFEPVSANEQYRIMERFIFKLDDEELASKLENALEQDKPLANFKSVVNNSNRRHSWEKFKEEAIMDYIKSTLFEGLRQSKEIEMNE